MENKFKLFFTIIYIVIFSSSSFADDKPDKIGFIYTIPTQDYGWFHQHELGRLALEKAINGKHVLTAVDVSGGSDADRAMRKLADSGHKLIFVAAETSSATARRTIDKYPDIKFEIADGDMQRKNVANYSIRSYEGSAVSGLVAGSLTKTNVLGISASVETPAVIASINAFTIAARRVNPSVKVHVYFHATWLPMKDRMIEVVELMIHDLKADVILSYVDSPVPLQTAEANNVFGLGTTSDYSAYAPSAHISSTLENYGGYYVARTRAFLDGTWKPGDYWGGIRHGMVGISPFNSVVPKSVQTAAQNTVKDLSDGTLHPFQGPIFDRDGKEVVPNGKYLSDAEIKVIDWYAQGIVSKR